MKHLPQGRVHTKVLPCMHTQSCTDVRHECQMKKHVHLYALLSCTMLTNGVRRSVACRHCDWERTKAGALVEGHHHSDHAKPPAFSLHHRTGCMRSVQLERNHMCTVAMCGMDG